MYIVCLLRENSLWSFYFMNSLNVQTEPRLLICVNAFEVTRRVDECFLVKTLMNSRLNGEDWYIKKRKT